MYLFFPNPQKGEMQSMVCEASPHARPRGPAQGADLRDWQTFYQVRIIKLTAFVISIEKGKLSYQATL
jgi:hypothetical protein